MRTLILYCAAVLLNAPLHAAESDVQWTAPLDIARGDGVRGPWQQNESRYHYVDDPAVAIAGDDTLVAWVDQTRKDVLLQRYTSEGKARWPTPIDVSRTPQTFSWLPRLVVADDGRTVHALWQEIIFSGGSHGGDILYARSGDGGRSFAAPINLSHSEGGDGKGRVTKNFWHNGSLDLARSGKHVYAVWSEYHGALWFSRSDDDGRSFTPPRRIAGDMDAPVRGPSIALGPNGDIHLAWTLGEQTDADIHYTASTDGGASFATPRRIAPDAHYADAPQLAVDRKGAVHMVYGQSAAGPFDAFHIRYIRSADGGRRFDAPRILSHPPLDDSVSESFPALRVNDSGDIVVVWERFTALRDSPSGLGFAMSRDGGRSFSKPRLVPHSIDAGGGSNGSHQGLLSEKLDLRGDSLAIVNSALRTGSHSRVWLVRGALRSAR